MAWKLLIDGATGTDATKQTFRVDKAHFVGNCVPGLKSRGLGTGDSIRVFEWVDGAWGPVATTLTPETPSRPILSVGLYAVDAVMATSGPVSCQLDAPNQIPD